MYDGVMREIRCAISLLQPAKQKKVSSKGGHELLASMQTVMRVTKRFRHLPSRATVIHPSDLGHSTKRSPETVYLYESRIFVTRVTTYSSAMFTPQTD